MARSTDETTALQDQEATAADSDRFGQTASKVETLELLKKVGEVVSAALGEWGEIVVHDLADLERSIVWIGGDVTGRKIGGHITDLGLARLRARNTEPLLNYISYTDDGKTLKCNSAFIADEKGDPVAAFCINLNVTPFILFDRFLRSMTSQGQEPDFPESFSPDLSQMVETTIAECAYQVGKPISLMTKSDRLKVVALLDKRGVFELRKSVPLVAQRLGVTQKTIYNYLAELEGSKQSNGAQ